MTADDQHDHWEALSRKMDEMGYHAPEVLPGAALDLVFVAMGYAVSLGVEPETIQGALGFAVERDPADRAAIEAFRALQRVVDNNGGSGPPVGGLDLRIHWSPETRRYVVNIEAGESDAGADATALEVAVVAAAMADEMEHHSVSDDGHLLCHECSGEGCPECSGTGLLEVMSWMQWPAGGLKVPEEHDGIIPDPLRELRSVNEGLREQVLEAQAQIDEMTGWRDEALSELQEWESGERVRSSTAAFGRAEDPS